MEGGETNVLLDFTKWKGGVEMEGASVALQEENESRMFWRTRLMLRRLLLQNGKAQKKKGGSHTKICKVPCNLHIYLVCQS